MKWEKVASYLRCDYAVYYGNNYTNFIDNTIIYKILRSSIFHVKKTHLKIPSQSGKF